MVVQGSHWGGSRDIGGGSTSPEISHGGGSVSSCLLSIAHVPSLTADRKSAAVFDGRQALGSRWKSITHLQNYFLLLLSILFFLAVEKVTPGSSGIWVGRSSDFPITSLNQWGTALPAPQLPAGVNCYFASRKPGDFLPVPSCILCTFSKHHQWLRNPFTSARSLRRSRLRGNRAHSRELALVLHQLNCKAELYSFTELLSPR